MLRIKPKLQKQFIRSITTFGEHKIQKETLSNGLKTISIQPEYESAKSSLTMIIKAGSRFESIKGFLLIYFKGTNVNTHLGMCKTADLLGASLNAYNTKENLVIKVESFKEDMNIVEDSSFHMYHYWTVRKQVEIESHLVSVDQQLVEKLHSIAFRNGLNNSIYSEYPSNVTSSLPVLNFARQCFNSNKITLILNNAEQKMLDDFDDFQSLNTKSEIDECQVDYVNQKSQFYPGYVQKPFISSCNYTLLGYQAAPSNHDDTLPTLILHKLLQPNQVTKWGEYKTKLNFKGAEKDLLVDYLHYSDLGMFYFFLKSKDNSSVTQLVDSIRSISIGDIEGAKKQLKLELLDFSYSSSLYSELYSNYGLSTSIPEILSKIESISSQQVSKVAESIFKSKPAMVSAGNPNKLLYPEDLKL